ncbi:MAG: tolR protein [Bdellovibrionaceae bacterium]|nr:tolR protein [Pseudobdellovibrionaceae bacterium]|tara:strand:- start:82 stop:558 length:477 start_codon:yes stop_codon:yes gene_type:complete
MAHIEETGKGGRETNVELNLVPFIDLMSVLIIFLLITAVWTHVSMIQIGSSVYGKKQEQQQEVVPPPLSEIVFRLDVRSDGFRVVFGGERFGLPKINGRFDSDGLLEQLRRLKGVYPDKVDAVITAQDDLPYKSLILGMDLLLTAGFPQISVATAEAE